MEKTTKNDTLPAVRMPHNVDNGTAQLFEAVESLFIKTWGRSICGLTTTEQHTVDFRKKESIKKFYELGGKTPSSQKIEGDPSSQKTEVSIKTDFGEYQFEVDNTEVYIKVCRLAGLAPLTFTTQTEDPSSQKFAPFGFPTSQKMPKDLKAAVKNGIKESLHAFSHVFYHDEKAKSAVWTDGIMFYASNRLYNEECAGKCVSEDGSVVDMDYPDYMRWLNIKEKTILQRVNAVIPDSDAYLAGLTSDGVPCFIPTNQKWILDKASVWFANTKCGQKKNDTESTTNKINEYLSEQRITKYSYSIGSTFLVGITPEGMVGVGTKNNVHSDKYRAFEKMGVVPACETETTTELQIVAGIDSLRRISEEMIANYKDWLAREEKKLSEIEEAQRIYNEYASVVDTANGILHADTAAA